MFSSVGVFFWFFFLNQADSYGAKPQQASLQEVIGTPIHCSPRIHQDTRAETIKDLMMETTVLEGTTQPAQFSALQETRGQDATLKLL